MKRISEEINDININVQPIELTEEERSKMINTAKNYSKKSFKWWKLAPVAAVIAIFLAFSNPRVMATGLSIAKDIEISFIDTFGSSSSVEDYVVGSEIDIKIGDDLFNLQSLAIDGDKVYTNTIVKGELMDSNTSEPMLYYLKVDGKKYNVVGTSGSFEMIDENLVLSTFVNTLEKDVELGTDEEVELGFYDGRSLAKVKLNSPEKLLDDSSHILVENFTIPDSGGVLIKEIKANPITIVTLLEVDDPDLVYEIYGEDSQGNIVELDQQTRNETSAEFMFNSDFSDVDMDYFLENYRDFTFTLYSWEMESGGRSLENGTQVGDSFNLN